MGLLCSKSTIFFPPGQIKTNTFPTQSRAPLLRRSGPMCKVSKMRSDGPTPGPSLRSTGNFNVTDVSSERLIDTLAITMPVHLRTASSLCIMVWAGEGQMWLSNARVPAELIQHIQGEVLSCSFDVDQPKFHAGRTSTENMVLAI